jgi:hypothetical protein
MNSNGVDQNTANNLFATIHEVLVERYEDAHNGEGHKLNTDEQHRLIQDGLSIFAKLSHLPNFATVINTYINPGDMFQYSQTGIEFQLSYLNKLVDQGIRVEAVEVPRWVPSLPERQRGGDVDIVINSLGKRIAVELKSHDWNKTSNIQGDFIMNDIKQLRRNLDAIDPQSNEKMFAGVRLVYPRDIPLVAKSKINKALSQLRIEYNNQSIEFDEL